MKIRYLILGSSGFLGSHFCSYLASQKYDVVGVDFLEPTFESAHYSHLKGDVTDEGFLNKAIENIDVVIDAASSVKPAQARAHKKDFLASSMRNALVLGEVCKNRIQKLVYISSAGEIYGNVDQSVGEEIENPLSAYGYGKLMTEQLFDTLLENSSTSFVAARISNPFGNPRSKTHGFVDVAINKTLQGEILEIWGTDQVTKDYIHIDDVCEAIEILTTKNCQHRIYNICQGKSHSLAHIIELINEFLTEKQLQFEIKAQEDVDTISSWPSPKRIFEEFSWQAGRSLRDYIAKRLHI